MKKFGFVPWGESFEQADGMMVQMYERPLDTQLDANPKDL